MRLETKQNEKKSLNHKSVELWLHITIWCRSKRCHPKMVSPGAKQEGQQTRACISGQTRLVHCYMYGQTEIIEKNVAIGQNKLADEDSKQAK